MAGQTTLFSMRGGRVGITSEYTVILPSLRYIIETTQKYRCMDARRTSDSQVVALKRIKSSSDEARISKMFSSQKHAENPANHCIPLLDVLQVPESDEVVLVMPWMCPVNDPPFRTIGGVSQFFQEILQVTVLPL